MTAALPILETTGLRAGYGEADVLRDVSIRVPHGAIVSVIGPNGAGKSTVLKVVYGLLRPRDGRVLLRAGGTERDVTGRRPHQITALGANYVPQLDNVFPNMSVLENLEIGAILRPQATAARLDKVFSWFPPLYERRRQRAATLSGGQRHMLALARALMTGPELLLVDEPSAGLAPTVVDELLAKLQEINGSGVTLVMVEQNARRSLAMSDYAYVLDMGRVRFRGRGQELLHDPRVVDLYLGGRGRLAEGRERGRGGRRPRSSWTVGPTRFPP